MKQAYILCGGLGTRLGGLVKNTPKPMLPVGGKPILQYTMEHLKRHGFTKAILVAGYKADVVKKFFEGVDFGLDIDIFIEEELLGSSGALRLLEEKLDEEFLLLSGDVFIDFDISAMIHNHLEHRPIVTFLSGPSTHPWDSNLIQVDKNDIVTRFVLKNEPKQGCYNNGDRSIYCVSKRILRYVPKGKSDLNNDVFPTALAAGETLRIYRLDPGDFVRDMGKPERFKIVEDYLRNRELIAEAKRNPKRISCVFLDRDGVINKEIGHLYRLEDVEVLQGTREALSIFRDNNIKVVVVTNQPVLARGLCTEKQLQRIHEKILSELDGVRWDALYYCPHHPETQWDEGVVKLRRGCDCRKPANGMLLQARRDLDLDLAECVMIGDSYTDVRTGKNTGVRTILLGKKQSSSDEKPTAVYDTLLDAATAIIRGRFQ